MARLDRLDRLDRSSFIKNEHRFARRSAEIYNTFFGAVLHTADLAGQAVPLDQALVWGERVIGEFSMQAQKEQLIGLPTAPFMLNLTDTANAANVQSGYITFILKPWWNSFKVFFPNNLSIIAAVKNIDGCLAFYQNHLAEAKSVKAKMLEEANVEPVGDLPVEEASKITIIERTKSMKKDF